MTREGEEVEAKVAKVGVVVTLLSTFWLGSRFTITDYRVLRSYYFFSVCYTQTHSQEKSNFYVLDLRESATTTSSVERDRPV